MSMAVARGGSATWRTNPISGDWNNAANWTPATVPNGPGDNATFDVSSQLNVMLSANTDVNSIVYDAAASAYDTTVPAGITLTAENGIMNNSAATQTLRYPTRSAGRKWRPGWEWNDRSQYECHARRER